MLRSKSYHMLAFYSPEMFEYLYLVIFKRESNMPHDDPNRVEIIF